jgi:hypothetical protein
MNRPSFGNNLSLGDYTMGGDAHIKGLLEIIQELQLSAYGLQNRDESAVHLIVTIRLVILQAELARDLGTIFAIAMQLLSASGLK